MKPLSIMHGTIAPRVLIIAIFRWRYNPLKPTIVPRGRSKQLHHKKASGAQDFSSHYTYTTNGKLSFVRWFRPPFHWHGAFTSEPVSNGSSFFETKLAS